MRADEIARQLLLTLQMGQLYGSATGTFIDDPYPDVRELATTILDALPGAWVAETQTLVMVLGKGSIGIRGLEPPAGATFDIADCHRAGALLSAIATVGNAPVRFDA